ncbi:MAG: inositol monophosphatase family protein [Desulfatirhabdiaceae bacterium]
MTMLDPFRIRNVAISAAYQAGAVLRRHLGNIHHLQKKGEIDLVSEADIDAEAVIIRTIHQAFPDHAIIAEESGSTGSTGSSGGCRWIVDPLDGTTNFAHQLGLFSVSIGFETNGEMVAGVVLNPVSGELFTAIAGKGAELNGKPIHTSQTTQLVESLLVTGFPYNFKEIMDSVMIRMTRCLMAAQGVRRLGSAALDLCYVACGRFEGFWEQNLKPWDVAAGSIIAREAGAVITDFSNHPFTVDSPELLATNGWIHPSMLELLRIKGTE